MNPKPNAAKAIPIYDLLRDLVAIPSVFPREQKIGQYVSKYLKNLGFTIEVIPSGPGRNNVVATHGTSDQYIAFYGHLDTVEPDNHYTRDPFTVWRHGYKAHGLGVADMKGGIVAILGLANFANIQNLPVKIIFGVDEENISVGAHNLIDASALSNVDFLISAESGQVKDMDQAYSVCYGRKGRLAVQVTITGKKTHAAESHKAVNAIEMAAIFVTQLNSIIFSNNSHFGFGTTNLVVHEISGSTDSFSIPDECSFILSVLTAPPTKHRTVLQKLKTLAKNLDITAVIKPVPRTTPYAESYEVNQKNAFLEMIETRVFAPAGVRHMYSESVADENIFANRLGIPVISIGPIGGGDHTVNEWVSLSSIEEVINCYQEILSLYAALKA